MADTKISSLDATNTEALRKQAFTSRGCLVGLSADLTAVNASSAYNIPFNAESYDTDSIHDNITNNTRMTVPSGWGLVRVGASVYVSSIAISEGFRMFIRHYNSAGVQQSGRGLPNFFADNSDFTEMGAAGVSAPIVVSAGDYFIVELLSNDTSITVVSSRTSAWMELLA